MSGINVETKSVTVEWFERGETKGKEVSDIHRTFQPLKHIWTMVIVLATFLINSIIFPDPYLTTTSQNNVVVAASK